MKSMPIPVARYTTYVPLRVDPWSFPDGIGIGTSLAYAIDEAPDAYKPMHLIRSAIAPAVDLHEVLPEIYNLKDR